MATQDMRKILGFLKVSSKMKLSVTLHSDSVVLQEVQRASAASPAHRTSHPNYKFSVVEIRFLKAD